MEPLKVWNFSRKWNNFILHLELSYSFWTLFRPFWLFKLVLPLSYTFFFFEHFNLFKPFELSSFFKPFRAWKLSKFSLKNVNGWQNNYSLSWTLSINWAFKVKRSYLTIRKSSPHFSPFPMGKNFPSPLFPIPHGEKIRWGYVNPNLDPMLNIHTYL